MTILIFGKDGQVGKALQEHLKNSEVPVLFLCRSDCDLADETSVVNVLNHYQPKIIINASGYTAVDKAESEPDLAYAINAKAPELMAKHIAKQQKGLFIHYSTDYVFADTKSASYFETDLPGPISKLNVYGKSKLLGEWAIKNIFSRVRHNSDLSERKLSRYLIFRTSWAYGDGENFIRKILHLSTTQNHLKVVNDQWGVPTDASWLAKISLQIGFSKAQSGIYHIVPDGETSRYDFARLCVQLAKLNGLDLSIELKDIEAIVSSNSDAVAVRPGNSRMSNQKLRQTLSLLGFENVIPYWEDQVKQYVEIYINTVLKKNRHEKI